MVPVNSANSPWGWLLGDSEVIHIQREVVILYLGLTGRLISKN